MRFFVTSQRLTDETSHPSEMARRACTRSLQSRRWHIILCLFVTTIGLLGIGYGGSVLSAACAAPLWSGYRSPGVTEPSGIVRQLTEQIPAFSPPKSSEAVYHYRKPSSDGIGKVYMGREIASVMGHQGAAWLERSSRKQEEKPWKILDALELDPTDTVVDLGAGTGYLTFQLAPFVPNGTVFAVDIQPEMLDMLSFFQQDRHINNVQPILAEPTNPHVPDGIDLVLMVDAYHELEYPHEVMRSVVDALNPGGRVVLAEYRGENPLIPIKRLHKMTERQVRRELEAVGLQWLKTDEQLPRQHLIFFQKL